MLSTSLLKAYPFLDEPKATQETCFNFQDVDPNITFIFGDAITSNNFNGIFGEFFFLGGGSTTGGSASTSSGSLFISNLNLSYEFIPELNSLSFTYEDFGGNVNLIINGSLLNSDDFTDFDGMSVAGVTIQASIPGFVELTGPISTLSIGGQELF